MSASRWIEVKLDQPRLKAGGAGGDGPAAEPAGPVSFRLYGDLPGLPSAVRSEAFVGSLAQSDPALAERLGRLLPELLRHEESLFEWMSRGDDHAQRFVQDPMGAIAEAVPDLSAELLADLQAVAQDLSASSQGGAR